MITTPRRLLATALAVFTTFFAVFTETAKAAPGPMLPASDLTLTVEELENGDVEFSLTGTAYFKQSMTSTYRTPSDYREMHPPTSVDNYEYFTLPDGLEINSSNGMGPVATGDLKFLTFNSSGYWTFESANTGTLDVGDMIEGSGKVVTDEVPFSNFVEGRYVVEGDYYDMIFVIRAYSPPRLSVPSKKKFSNTRVRKSSRASKIKVRNVGGTEVNSLSVRMKGSARKDYRIRRRPSSRIAPGRYSVMKVSFRPRSAGNRRAKILFSSNARTVKTNLRGKGTVPRTVGGPLVPGR